MSYAKFFIVFAGLLVSSLWSQAQLIESKPDSLHNRKEIESLLDKARNYLKTNPDSTLTLAERVVTFSDSNKFKLADIFTNLVIQAKDSLLEINTANTTNNNFNLDKNPTKLIYNYIILGTDLFKLEKFELAKYYFDQTLKMIKTKEPNLQTAYCKNSIGTILFMQNKFETAMTYHLESLKIYKLLNRNDEIALAYYTIGSDYSALCIYDKSIEYYLIALKMYEKMNDSDNIAMIYHAISLVYEDIGNIDEAHAYNIKALKLVNRTNWQIYTSILKWLGTINLKEGHFNKAEEYLKLSLQIENGKKPHIGRAITLSKLGEVYFNLNEVDSASNYYVKAMCELKGLKENWVKVRLYYLFGNVYIKSCHFSLAIKYLNKALILSKQLKLKDLSLDIYRSLSILYKDKNNFRKALDTYTEHINLRDSIHTKNSHRIAEMQLRYETDKREKENEILRRSNAIQQLQIEKQTLVQTIQLLFLIVFAALSGFLLFRYHVNMKVNRSLQREIDATMEREREQQQIIIHQAGLTSLGEMAASIVHDVLQPIQNIRLTAESVAIKVIDEPADQTAILSMMNEIKEDVLRTEKIVNHIRIFARKDKLTEYDKFYVNDAIQDAVMITRRQFKSQKISIETKLSENLPVLNGNHHNFEQLMINLLFNARDAIYQRRTQNPILAGEIKIETVLCENEIKMFLSDNGVGIPDHIKVNIFKPFFTTKKAGIGTGLGLVIVRKMIKELNGKIDYQSIVDEGTTVVVGIPVSGELNLTERMPA